MSSVRRRQFVLALLAVVSVGIALRSLPLWLSPLPFNPDGILHARNAEITVRTGHIPLSLDGVFADDLGFASLLAVVELLTGVDSLHGSQPLIALVGTFPAVVAVVLARRLGAGLGWSPGKARLAGLLAGALLATEGIYLYRSMPVDEQTPGLFIVPLALAAVVYGLWQGDRRWLVAAVPLLLYIPPLHNLESIIVGLSLVAVLGVAVFRPERRRETVAVAAVIAVGFWVYFTAYNFGLAALTPTGPHQNDRVATAPGLLVAWVILSVVGIAWFRRVSDRTQRLVLLVPFAVLFGLMSVNVVVPVFPGLPKTTPAFFVATMALSVPTFIACWGYPLLAQRGENHAVLMALFAGPLALIGFAITAELSPVYFATGTRTHWFLHLPVMALAGATGAYLLGKRFGSRRAVRLALTGLLVLSVVVSVPIAFGGLSVYSYKGVTTTGEFAASTFAHERVDGPWASDDHLVRISRYHPPNGSGTVAPVYTWVHDSSAPPPDCPALTKDSWTTAGAQFYPRPPEALADDRLEQLDAVSHRVYHGGSSDRLRLFQSRNGSSMERC